MTQTEALIDLFRQHGNRLTLGDIMQTTLGCEYRARMTELRHKGYTITCKINRKQPTRNEYVLIEPVAAPTWKCDEQGQTAFV